MESAVDDPAPEPQSDTSSSAAATFQSGALLRHFKGPAARGFVPPPFVQPDGIAIDRERNRIMIADSANHRVVSVCNFYFIFPGS
jgi:sugar lactone lactonase YvrE